MLNVLNKCMNELINHYFLLNMGILKWTCTDKCFYYLLRRRNKVSTSEFFLCFVVNNVIGNNQIHKRNKCYDYEHAVSSLH